MLSAVKCRQFAVQCIEWRSRIDDASQWIGFTTSATTWLAVAAAIENTASEHGIGEIAGFRTKLN